MFGNHLGEFVVGLGQNLFLDRIDLHRDLGSFPTVRTELQLGFEFLGFTGLHALQCFVQAIHQAFGAHVVRRLGHVVYLFVSDLGDQVNGDEVVLLYRAFDVL